MKRIPFDSLSLAISLAEMRQLLLGGKLQRVLTLDETTVALAIYSQGAEQWIVLSADANFARAHILKNRPKSVEQANDFAKLMRGNLDGARLLSIDQVGFDRIAHFVFETLESKFTLVAELMGKHSNLILVGPGKRVVACIKSVGVSKSSRPITIGRTYSPPPFAPRKSILAASSWEEAKSSEGASPFLVSLLSVIYKDWAAARDMLNERLESGFEAYMVEGYGVYPLDPNPLGYSASRVASVGQALDAHFSTASSELQTDLAKSTLHGQLDRVMLARQAAIHDLEQAIDTAKNAAKFQLMGELILSHLHEIREGQTRLEAVDYEGNDMSIPLVADQTGKENAVRLFSKAKRAKAHAPVLMESLHRFRLELHELQKAMNDLSMVATPSEVERIRRLASEKKWLHSQRTIEKSTGKPIDPYEGHRIRTLVAPGGLHVLYGENATSNDYLTMRIAKPNDWWLHIRGSTSAHVVIQTHNQPAKVSAEALRFAAKIAVKNSASKHSGYVPVDYTLKKYVRRPKGAHPGTALYTNEKTIHIEGE